MIPTALIPALGQLIELVPNITKWLTGSDSDAAVADKVISVAKAVTGISDPKEAAAALAADESLKRAFEKQLLDQDLEIAKLQIQVIADVNKTMQVEAAAEHWPTYAWRPFIGFSFGFWLNSVWLLPLVNKIPVMLSTDVMLAIGGILGVASWFRGKMQADPNIPTINKG